MLNDEFLEEVYENDSKGNVGSQEEEKYEDPDDFHQAPLPPPRRGNPGPAPQKPSRTPASVVPMDNDVDEEYEDPEQHPLPPPPPDKWQDGDSGESPYELVADKPALASKGTTRAALALPHAGAINYEQTSVSSYSTPHQTPVDEEDCGGTESYDELYEDTVIHTVARNQELLPPPIPPSSHRAALPIPTSGQHFVDDDAHHGAGTVSERGHKVVSIDSVRLKNTKNNLKQTAVDIFKPSVEKNDEDDPANHSFGSIRKKFQSQSSGSTPLSPNLFKSPTAADPKSPPFTKSPSPSVSSPPPQAIRSPKHEPVPPRIPSPPPPRKPCVPDVDAPPKPPPPRSHDPKSPTLSEDKPAHGGNGTTRAALPLPHVDAINYEQTSPAPPIPPPLSKNSLSSFSWYFGDVDRHFCENKLAALNQSGAFLVRTSKTGGNSSPYSISIFYQNLTYHLLIRVRSDDKFALGSEKNDEKVFNSVAEMVAFHQNNPIELIGDGKKAAGHVMLTKSPPK